MQMLQFPARPEAFGLKAQLDAACSILLPWQHSLVLKPH
jgi:hypothetical protein